MVVLRNLAPIRVAPKILMMHDGTNACILLLVSDLDFSESPREVFYAILEISMQRMQQSV